MRGRLTMSGVLLAALLGAGGTLYAQGRDTSRTDGGMRQMHEMMSPMMQGSPMMGMMAAAPEAALARADELGLSDAQRQRLRELAKARRDVLTADQRAKLAQLQMKDMMGMMRMMSSMMGGGMMDGMGGMMGSDSTRADHH